MGRWAGAVMVLGLLGVPSWVAGVDDPADAPWHAWVATLGWLGTYVLYPAWCLRVRRAGDVGRARPPGRRPQWS